MQPFRKKKAAKLGMYAPPSSATLLWVAEACGGLGSVPLSFTQLAGGTTADVDLVLIRDGRGRAFHVVLRRWTDSGPRTHGRVEREVAALQALSDQKVRAPRLLAFDSNGDDAGVRCVAMSRVPGEVILRPRNPFQWISGLAEAQAEVHRVPAYPEAITSSWFDSEGDFSWIVDAGLRRDALVTALEAEQQPVFVHGDYQQFNVFWLHGKVSGILDWTMTGTGLRGVDVGHCRLNLAALYSVGFADLYLTSYERASGVTVDPRAELLSFLSWTPKWANYSIPRELLTTMRVEVNEMSLRVVEMVRFALRRLV